MLIGAGKERSVCREHKPGRLRSCGRFVSTGLRVYVFLTLPKNTSVHVCAVLSVFSKYLPIHVLSCLLFFSASMHAGGRRLIKVDVKVTSLSVHIAVPHTVSEMLQTLWLLIKTLNKENCHWFSFQAFILSHCFFRICMNKVTVVMAMTLFTVITADFVF